MKRLMLLAIAPALAVSMLWAAWRYVYPPRDLLTVTENRWHRYSEEYVSGYIRGFKRADFDLTQIPGTDSGLGILVISDLARATEQRSLAELEVAAKTGDELSGCRDGYLDVMKDIWEKPK